MAGAAAAASVATSGRPGGPPRSSRGGRCQQNPARTQDSSKGFASIALLILGDEEKERVLARPTACLKRETGAGARETRQGRRRGVPCLCGAEGNRVAQATG